ncbi:hypothetical protein RFI_00733 [Reticulomyxa filosa]|uniref:Uncharacterized protein n=1 Tax=Reticulomyxa filosa TaxID=46433 RepID=X6PE46_RETFI|nr:hypothetical protein RFI_00733 [Reticulomyxa filosa]|eukprot:ETO36329.1 hypothetical protein RFI_00733 [Reticulomyxa filosa]
MKKTKKNKVMIKKKTNEDDPLTNEEIATTETAILNLLQKIQQLKSHCGSLTQALSAIPRKRIIKESNLRNEIKQVASTNNMGCDCVALMKMIKYAATINIKLKISYSESLQMINEFIQLKKPNTKKYIFNCKFFLLPSLIRNSQESLLSKKLGTIISLIAKERKKFIKTNLKQIT